MDLENIIQKWQNPDTEGHIFYDSFSKKECPDSQIQRDRKKISGWLGLEAQEEEEWLFIVQISFLDWWKCFGIRQWR